MNGRSKIPLATMATALALTLGPLSAQAGETDSNQQATDVADSRAADMGKQAKTADQAPDADVAAGNAAKHVGANSDVAASNDAAEQVEANLDVVAGDDVEPHQVSTAAADDSGREDVAASDEAAVVDATARSKSFTKTISTPHMTMSVSRSVGVAKDQDGDMAMARAMAKAKALDTPGVTRTDTATKTTVRVEGDAEADAAASANASIDAGGMSVETFAKTSVAVE